MASWDPGRLESRSRLKALARMLRVEHTLFSLPFAYAGAALAWPGALRDPRVDALIALAVLGLRSAAMAFNNIADLEIDRLNPRTRGRPLVTGALPVSWAWAAVAAGSLLYYASAALLNRYALLFSPLLWLLALSYPYAKRLHWLPHLHLGLTLGLVVFGGAVAAYGAAARGLGDLLARIPWDYVAAVTLWVAGFDVYYAIMDLEFDRRHGLGSAPARLGVRGALRLSLALHAASLALLAAGVALRGLGPVAAAGVAAAAALVAYQHALIRRGLENIPRAFNVNLALGVIISAAVIADILLSRPPVGV
ncbi:UbiA-like polyprenyltransferase [Stetteria hydrogenophila]